MATILIEKRSILMKAQETELLMYLESLRLNKKHSLIIASISSKITEDGANDEYVE